MNTYRFQLLWLVPAILIAQVGCKPRNAEKVADVNGKPVNRMGRQAEIVDATDLPPARSTAGASSDYRSILMTSNLVMQNLAKVDANSLWCVQRYVMPDLFKNTNVYRIDTLFERLVDGDIKYGSSVTGMSYRSAAQALSYRALLPYLQEALLAGDATNRIDRAWMCRNMIYRTAHADTLRVWSEIDERLPANSPLRCGRIPVWNGNMPFFKRTDCMEVYREIVNHPERYDFNRWYGIVEMIPQFTNETAVASLQFALGVVQNPEKYWSGMKPSLYVWSVEEKLKNQQEIMQGKRGPINMDRDKPFDE